ncbi:MAG: glycosyltransferase family 2 protein [Dehalococcoidia bacterium]
MAAQERGLPSVAILTINYNSAPYIGDFLASLGAITYPNYRLVMVDNASADGSPDQIPRLVPQAVLIRNSENLGITGGHNVGIRYCLEQSFDYVLFLNSDTVVSPDFLDHLVESADKRTMVAPKTYLYDRPGLLDDTVGDFDWWRGVWRGWLYAKPEPPGFHRPREVNMASLCCLLVPAAVFHDVGLMDERFFMYYDDFDFVARAKAAGYRLRLNPAAVIHHRKAASSGGVESPFKLYYATRNRLYLMKKHSSRLRFAVFLAYFMAARVAYFAVYLARGQGRQLRAMLMGISDFFRGRLGRTHELAYFG